MLGGAVYIVLFVILGPDICVENKCKKRGILCDHARDYCGSYAAKVLGTGAGFASQSPPLGRSKYTVYVWGKGYECAARSKAVLYVPAFRRRAPKKLGLVDSSWSLSNAQLRDLLAVQPSRICHQDGSYRLHNSGRRASSPPLNSFGHAVL